MLFIFGFLQCQIVLFFNFPVYLSLLPLACIRATSPPAYNDSGASRETTSPRERPYSPFYAKRGETSEQERRGTLKDDFLWAADAPTIEIAAARWEEFLKLHRAGHKNNSTAEEYEDVFQANHVSAARYELMRVCYLLGRVEDGDRILR